MTTFGVVVTPEHPAFPKRWLILGGSLGLGLGLGLTLAVLIELLNRRVRGVEDLNGDLDPTLHCLAVISSGAPGEAAPLFRLPRFAPSAQPPARAA
jgi:hypothetical protein